MRPLILLAALLLVAGCDDDKSASKSKTAEAARIEREVKRRVDAAGIETAAAENRLRTIRVIGFIVLAGGAAAALLKLRHPAFSYSPERPLGTPLPRTSRVIDFPQTPPGPNPTSLNPHHRRSPP
jgi:hypothetical protein